MDEVTIQMTLFGGPILPKCCETCVSLGSDLSNGVALGCVKKLHMKDDCQQAVTTKQQAAKQLREERAKEKSKKPKAAPIKERLRGKLKPKTKK